MAVKQKVASEAEQIRVFRPVLRLLDARDLIRQQQHWWNRGFGDERLPGPQAARIHILAGKFPPHPVWMKIMSVSSDIEVEDVPTDSLTGPPHDSWGVSHKAPAVDAECRDRRDFIRPHYRSNLRVKSQIQRSRQHQSWGRKSKGRIQRRLQRSHFPFGRRWFFFALHHVKEHRYVIRRNVI